MQPTIQVTDSIGSCDGCESTVNVANIELERDPWFEGHRNNSWLTLCRHCRRGLIKSLQEYDKVELAYDELILYNKANRYY